MFRRGTFIFSLIIACAVGNASCDGEGPIPSTSPASSANQTHRLYRVEIPAGSKYRDAKFDEDEPDLRVQLFRNGDPLGKVSQTKSGWEAEFSASDPANRYAIDHSGDASFSINLYDHDSTDPDDLIVSITGLSATDFDKPIVEKLSPNDPADRAVKIEFKQIR